MKNALNALPQEHHVTIMLVCVEGYSYSEAASVLEVPAGTVASRVARARTTLGKLLYNIYSNGTWETVTASSPALVTWRDHRGYVSSG